MPADDLNDFARDLGQLRPTPALLDRHAVLYRAGFAAGRRSLARPLGAAAVAAGVLAVTFAALWARERRPSPERVVFVPVAVQSQPAPPQHESPPPDFVAESVPAGGPKPVVSEPSFLTARQKLEEHLLRWGLDGLPPPPSTPSEPRLKAEDLLGSL
jgi:hypothetical protein